MMSMPWATRCRAAFLPRPRLAPVISAILRFMGLPQVQWAVDVRKFIYPLRGDKQSETGITGRIIRTIKERANEQTGTVAHLCPSQRDVEFHPGRRKPGPASLNGVRACAGAG